jgi:hypothetical protein
MNELRITLVFRKTILSVSESTLAQRGIPIYPFCIRRTTKKHGEFGQPVCARTVPLRSVFEFVMRALALAISLILRSRAAQITALILTLIAGASAYPVFVTGQRAYKTIRGLSDDPGADWLDEHMDRAEKTIPVFYFLAALAISGLLVPIKWPKSAAPLTALTLAVAILCSGIAVYIAQPGGRIRHPEFRPSETPTPASETDHHDKK